MQPMTMRACAPLCSAPAALRHRTVRTPLGTRAAAAGRCVPVRQTSTAPLRSPAAASAPSPLKSSPQQPKAWNDCS